MNELSSILREVLRALGVEEWERTGLVRGDTLADAGDFHQRPRPPEFTRA
ncbi:MAG TPA: hypothetical protein VF771_10150 [Longimicrobiaceae bacterium]